MNKSRIETEEFFFKIIRREKKFAIQREKVQFGEKKKC